VGHFLFQYVSVDTSFYFLETSMKRREALSNSALMSLAIAAGLVPAAHAQATWNKGAFDSKNLADAVKAFGGAAPALSDKVQLTGPDIAENGAVVPVGASSSLEGTTMLAILVEKNPNALAAAFEVLPGTDANVSTRVKMGQSSNVFALAKVGDKYFYAVKEVKVTLGGCGG
jgi:sulfur-oxidizing protein SoxY